MRTAPLNEPSLFYAMSSKLARPEQRHKYGRTPINATKNPLPAPHAGAERSAAAGHSIIVHTVKAPQVAAPSPDCSAHPADIPARRADFAAAPAFAATAVSALAPAKSAADFLSAAHTA